MSTENSLFSIHFPTRMMTERPSDTDPDQAPLTELFSHFALPFTRYRTIALALFLLGIAALGMRAFNPMFGGDSWRFITEDTSPMYISSGRWGWAILHYLLFSSVITPTVSIFGYISLSAIAGIATASILRRTSHWEIFFFSALLIFCPAVAEHLLFYSHCIPIAVGMLLCAFTLATTRALLYKGPDDDPLPANYQQRRLLLILGGTASLAFAMGIRQSFLLYYLVLALGMLLFELHLATSSDHLKEAVKNVFLLSVTALLGSALYLIGWNFSLWITDLPLHNSGWVGERYSPFSVIANFPEYLPETIRLVLEDIKQFFFQEGYLWAFEAKVIFILISLSYLGHHLKEAISSRFFWGPLLKVTLWGAMLITPWVIAALINSPPSFKYTALLGLVPVYPICFSLAYQQTQKLGKILIGVGALRIALCFIITHNAFSVFNLYLNKRDFSFAEQILSDIKHHPDFVKWSRHQDPSIIILGHPSGAIEEDPILPQLSALHAQRSKKVPLQTIGGYYKAFPVLLKLLSYRLPPIGRSTFRIIHRDWCNINDVQQPLVHRWQNLKQWPDQQSILIKGKTLVLRLGPLLHFQDCLKRLQAKDEQMAPH